MKKIFQYMVCASLALVTLAGCKEDKKVVSAPTIDLATLNIRSIARPGQIVLKWDKPMASDFMYMKVEYHDLRTNKDVSVNVSTFADSLVIEETRARFGKEYSFKFTPFFDHSEAGKPFLLEKCESGPAPRTVVDERVSISLKAANFTTNAQESSEGPLRNICDNNNSTFFHTSWSNPGMAEVHWIEVDMGQDLTRFEIQTVNRQGNAANAPGNISVYAISKLNDTGAGNLLAEYTLANRSSNGVNTQMIPSTDSDDLTTPVRFIRFAAVNNGGAKFWNLAEFKVIKIIRQVIDPEADEVKIAK